MIIFHLLPPWKVRYASSFPWRVFLDFKAGSQGPKVSSCKKWLDICEKVRCIFGKWKKTTKEILSISWCVYLWLNVGKDTIHEFYRWECPRHTKVLKFSSQWNHHSWASRERPLGCCVAAGPNKNLQRKFKHGVSTQNHLDQPFFNHHFSPTIFRKSKKWVFFCPLCCCNPFCSRGFGVG